MCAGDSKSGAEGDGIADKLEPRRACDVAYLGMQMRAALGVPCLYEIQAHWRSHGDARSGVSVASA